MPRIRSLKYEYFINEDLAETSAEARLLGLALTTLADREGRLEDRPVRIKVLVFPYHDVDVDSRLTELQNAGFLHRYTVEDKRYIRIVNFLKHQKPHPRETESVIPGHERVRPRRAKASPIVQNPTEQVESSRRNGSGNGLGDLGSLDNGNSEGRGTCSKAALVSQIFEFWKQEMNHPKAQLTKERKVKIEERLEDSTVEEIQTAILGCKRSDFHMGREPGKAQVFDDIELICRKRNKLEHFIALVSATNGHKKSIPYVLNDAKEVCLRCHNTGTETTPNGSRYCNHQERV